jgi:hypothetical protein
MKNLEELKIIAKKIILKLEISKLENLLFICERREWGLIFFNDEKNNFIRFWNKNILKKEFKNQEDFLSFWFKIPKIISSFEEGDYFIYIENKIWNEVLWKKIFNKNISYKKWFNEIYSVANNFFESKKLTFNINWNADEVKNSVKFNIFLKECEEHKIIEKDLIKKFFEKIDSDLEKNKKYELVHWDFNVMNLLKDWFIDVEDSYNWTIWFDLISLITHNYWFPINWSLKIAFSYNVSDIEKLIKLHDEKTWKSVEDYFDLSFMLRSIWSCVLIWDRPDLQKFRYNRIKKYITKYLNWENLLEEFLDEVDSINKILEKNKKS